jgi:DNA-directed RNA polymerase subunit M/transcription elongation factor TFIIS
MVGDDDRSCPHCGATMEQREDLNTTFWECPQCGHTEDENENEGA